MSKVAVERRRGVTVVTLNRPEVHNAIDGESAGLLDSAIRAFAEDDESRVLVITGSGDRSFCSGADLEAVGGLTERPGFERSGPLGFARLDPAKPTIAAINGYCFAGGLELACWCDVRVASENAEFGVLNRRFGVPLVDGGTQRLPRIVGIGNAMYLSLTGVRIDAAVALRMGLVSEVVPTGRAVDRAVALADAVARYPQASLRADRSSILASADAAIENGLENEWNRGRATLWDPEMRDALQRFASGDRPEAPRPA